MCKPLGVVTYTEFHPLKVLNVPKWIPGLSWIKREAEASCALGTRTKDTLYQWVRRRIVSVVPVVTENEGNNTSLQHAKEVMDPSTMVIGHINRMEKMHDSDRAEYEDSLKFTAVSSFLGKIYLNHRRCLNLNYLASRFYGDGWLNTSCDKYVTHGLSRRLRHYCFSPLR